jgi:signal transduction histidine kinase
VTLQCGALPCPERRPVIEAVPLSMPVEPELTEEIEITALEAGRGTTSAPRAAGPRPVRVEVKPLRREQMSAISVYAEAISSAPAGRRAVRIGTTQPQASSSGVGRFVLDPTTGEMTWNAELFTILGYPEEKTPSPEALLARIHSADSRLLGPTSASAQARLMRLARTERSVIDVRVVQPDGAPRRVSLKAEVVEEADLESNQVSIVVMGVVLDTTERALLEQQLLRQQHARTLSALTSGIAHEFNNPVQTIMNYAHLIATTADDPVLADFAGEILEATERVSHLMRSVLEYAKIDSGTAQAVNLSEVVEGALALTQTMLRKDGIIVESNVRPDFPPITGVPSQLKQALVSLVTNSQAALNQRFPRPTADKVMAITASRTSRGGQEWLELEIRDRGIGIPLELQLEVFEPFVSSKQQEGAGLGLAICRNIVEHHGGTIHIESDGSTYTAVTLAFPRRGCGSPLESLRPSINP